MYVSKPKTKTLFQTRKRSQALLALFLAVLMFFFLFELFAPDKKVSEKENRTLQQRPKFSFSTLFDGSYISKVETYYSDQFPFRNFFLNVNTKVQSVFSRFAAGNNDVVIVNTKKTGDDFGGQSLQDVQNAGNKEKS